MPNIKTYMVRSEFQDSMTESTWTEYLIRAVNRRTEWLKENVLAIDTAEQYQDLCADRSHRKLILRFLRNPTELYQNNGRLGGIRMERQKLEGKPNE